MSLVETFTAAKQAGDPQRLLDAVPYSRFLNLAGAVVRGELVTTMRFAPEVIGNPALPAIHGGALGALLESAAIFELLWHAETIVLPKTITLTVAYLRSGAPVDTHAHAIVTRRGRRVANVRVEAWQADRAAPVATAHGIFMVMRADSAAAAS